MDWVSVTKCNRILSAATTVTLLALTACTASAETSTPAPSSTTSVSVPDSLGVYLVTKVVDGDTIDVAGPYESTLRIRVIGIDTPEMKTCAGQPAKDAMANLVSGQLVVLTAAPGKDDTDRYGRFLRYVDLANGTDTGLTLIQEGYAIARYDSRDGYGAHPRELSYIAADEAAPDYVCPAGTK